MPPGLGPRFLSAHDHPVCQLTRRRKHTVPRLAGDVPKLFRGECARAVGASLGVLECPYFLGGDLRQCLAERRGPLDQPEVNTEVEHRLDRPDVPAHHPGCTTCDKLGPVPLNLLRRNLFDQGHAASPLNEHPKNYLAIAEVPRREPRRSRTRADGRGTRLSES